MIIIYDQGGTHDALLDELMKPTGVEFKLIKNFSEDIISDESPSSVIMYVNGGVEDHVKEFLLRERRDFLVILMSEKEFEVDERIKYSSEILIIDPNNIDDSRKKLRKALTSHTLRKMKTINDASIYLAKNGLYPGIVYYTRPENGSVFMSLIMSNTIDKSRVLVASRYNLMMEMPDVLSEENFVWVTDSIGAQRNRPVNLTFIIDSIIKRIIENDSFLVFIDIFDLLIVYHSFYDVARAFEQIKSLAIERNIYLILVFGEQAMDHIQFGQITRFALEWKPKSISDLN